MSDGIAVLSPAVFRSWSRLFERVLVEGRNHRLGDVAEKKWLMPKLAPGNGFTQ